MLPARIVAAGFLAGLALSWRLWASLDRLYPRAPLVPLPTGIEIALTLLLAGALVLVILGRYIWMRVAAAVTVVLLLADQTRIQPWVYEYVLLLIALSFGSRNACRTIIVALYFWSGIQKLNATFLHQVWPDMIGMAAPLLTRFGAVVPVAETLLPLGLLIRPLRRICAFGLVAMHLFIVVSLLITHENSVVLPWNATQAALVLLLFARKEDFALWTGASRFERVVQFAVWVLPIFSLFGWWDAFMSNAIYTGNTVEGVFVIDPAVIPYLPPVIRRNTWQQYRPMFIDLNRWAYDELNVPAYPSERVLQQVALQICGTFIHRADKGMLVIHGRPNWRTGVRVQTRYPCPE